MKENIIIVLLIVDLLFSGLLGYVISVNGGSVSALGKRLTDLEVTEVDQGKSVLFLMGKKAKP